MCFSTDKCLQALDENCLHPPGHRLSNWNTTMRSSLTQNQIHRLLPNQPGLTISYIKCHVSSLAEEYGAKKVSLIGSFARGEERLDSDVDILLEKGKIKGMQVLEFQDELEQRLNRKVDVITTTGISTRFLERVKRDAIVLYEAGQTRRALSRIGP